jgi:hypothetical protein
MSEREPRRCDFCLQTVETYAISEDGKQVTCMQCPGWNVFVRASQDQEYRRQMVHLLVGLPEPKPWDCDENQSSAI